MQEVIKLIRINQWIKNLFLFLPLFFDLRIFDLECLLMTSAGFISFSLMASAVYVFNDYLDIEDDRKHPVKKNRPLANAKVSVKTAIGLMIIFAISSLLIGILLPPLFTGVVVIYLIINMLYSFKLKHIPILDIFLVSLGFVLRVFAGGIICSIEPSAWLIMVTLLLALFIALAKRRDDVLLFISSGEKMRKSIDGYNLDFLNSAMSIMASIVIVAYLMYSLSHDVMERLKTENLYISSVFVILGILRYLQLAYVEEDTGSPTEILFKDRFLQFTMLGWIFCVALILYKF